MHGRLPPLNWLRSFEAAARHTLGHIYNPDHGHTH